jgi:hypothetical protein
MRQYLTLVRLFWQQLIRRKSLWIVMALVGVVLLINGMIRSQMEAMLQDGVRYDIATRRAAAALEGYAAQIRQGAVLLVLVVGALIAPAARRDGTTQFVLTLSVSRRRLALAQFGALVVFVFLGTVVIHVGYSAAAQRLGVVRLPEALFGWFLFLLPLLLLTAASFSLSLTRPALVVYAILLGVPYLVLPLLTAFIASWTVEVPEALRLLAARLVDNVGLLFPKVEPLVIWPRITPPVPERPPYPAWGLEVLHAVASGVLWMVVGFWAYRRHDFGSRIPAK